MSSSNLNQPAIREFLRGLWKERVRTWFDFQAYLRQRRAILSDPDLRLVPTNIDIEWKSPLGFVTQGLIIVTLVVTSIGFIFRAVFPPPEVVHLDIKVTQDGRIAWHLGHRPSGWERFRSHPRKQ